MRRVNAIYRCRRCSEVYKGEEYDGANLSVCQLPMGLYRGERIPPSPVSAAMVDLHTCDACDLKIGVADLIGWE